ncbi:MAG: hypothetical protein ACLFQP_11920, partial [Halothece sp.]
MTPISNPQIPRFWQLFVMLRTAGMELTLDQLGLLHQANEKGYDLEDVETLRRVCRLLWVKPNRHYDGEIFEKTFTGYLQQQPLRKPQQPEATATTSTPPPQSETTSRTQTPPQQPDTPPSHSTQIPRSVRTSRPFPSPQRNQTFHFSATDIPIPPDVWNEQWKRLSRLKIAGKTLELDREATEKKIEQEGKETDVVMRPKRVHRSELLVLVDDSNAMIPFLPMLQPLFKTLEKEKITLTRLYRFTRYPDEFLYLWQMPVIGEPIDDILLKLHQSRTFVLIFSEAGAATRSYNPEQVKGITHFLAKLRANIQSWLWVNPLPSNRWPYSSAFEIAKLPGGRMISLEELPDYDWKIL